MQVLPECGTFAKAVHSAVFPAIQKMKEAEDAGQPRSVAVGAGVPTLVKAFAKALGCREMCQAVVDTCSCNDSAGDSMSFGDALTAAKANIVLLQKVRPSVVATQLCPGPVLQSMQGAHYWHAWQRVSSLGNQALRLSHVWCTTLPALAS